MSTLLSRGRHCSRGQALVEFSLMAPIFFILLLVTIEGGRFVLFYETLNNATRDGARYAIVNGSNSGPIKGCPSGPMPGDPDQYHCDRTGELVKDRVRDSAFNLLGPLVPCDGQPGLCVPDPQWRTVDGRPGTNERGQLVTVRATYTYETVIPLLPIPSLSIDAESTLVVNN
jgi:hypothetical protein